MSFFKPGEAAAIKAIRTATGLGLRESQHALQQYGSAEKAIAALSNMGAVEEYESTITKALRQAELYRALRDSGLYTPAADGCGWCINHNTAKVTAGDMDAAAAKLLPKGGVK